jgi:hypothetical protein
MLCLQLKRHKTSILSQINLYIQQNPNENLTIFIETDQLILKFKWKFKEKK